MTTVDKYLPVARRINSVDLLRGLIMVIMALDHVREYWSQTAFRPEDLGQTNGPLFFTRWITYFCAPLFVFLAGISVSMHEQKSNDKAEVSRYLLRRGLWLLFLEVVVVSFLLQFGYNLIILQVIWVIGWGFIVLAGLIWLPRKWVLLMVILTLGGHNLFNDIQPVNLNNALLAMLHNSPFLLFPPSLPPILFSYAPIPWVAVLALGYLAGYWYQLPDGHANRAFRLAGFSALGLFLLLRAINIYGDPFPWAEQTRGTLYTIISFLSVTKYPPSLLFLLMTLGTGMVLLSFFDGTPGRMGRVMVTFGRVPLFYYLLHLPLIVGAAVIWAFFQFHQLTIIAFATSLKDFPSGYESSLLRTYLIWIIVVGLLYFPCKWYNQFKRKNGYRWLA